MKKKLPLLFFWFPCYFSNAGRSNYSTTSKFYLFCLLNFTNNYVFRPLNLLLNCRLHPHCFSFLESKEGTVRWTTPYPLVSMDSFSLHCAIYVAIIVCFHSGELHDSDDCDQPVRVHGLWQSLCVPQVISVLQSCQDSCQSIFTDVQGSRSWLSGAEGGEQKFGPHGRRVWCCWVCTWCSAPATMLHGVSGISHLFAVKTKLGTGISLD